MAFPQLSEKILYFEARVVVMGLGYVGLPLATELARGGLYVTGYDPDRQKVDSVNRGESYVDYPSSDMLSYQVESGMLKATDDPSVISEADIVVICVPTPLGKTKEPDLSLIQSAVETIAKYQHEDMLVVLESTSYPGTTRELLVPQLTQKFTLGESVFIGYSPERIDPGNPDYTLINTHKLVSGVTTQCLTLTQLFYMKLGDLIVRTSSPEVAEMAKVLENTYRAVNIGLANEIALICRRIGVDPFEVIDAAATKPFGFTAFYPGPGLGGHCIPVDPLYLSWKMKGLQVPTRFIDLADAVNGSMPDHVVSLVSEALNAHSKPVRGSSVLVVGMGYKADVADTRESPAIPIIERLRGLGAKVGYEDPLVSEEDLKRHHGLDIERYTDDPCLCESSIYASFDVTLILTAGRSFNFPRIRAESNLVVDTRGIYRKYDESPTLFRL